MNDDTRVWDDDEDEGEEPGGVFEPEAGMAVWVMADKCPTCIFHPGNRMHLEKGRVQQMVRDSVAAESHITCHDTLLYGHQSRLRPAVCRGYYDHPQGHERSIALRTGRALGTIHYQRPTKEPSMLLAELIATTGLSMRIKRGDVQRHSTGWTSRAWKVTYAVDDTTFRTTFHLGNVDEEPDLLESLSHTLEVVRLVKSVKCYEEWGQEQGTQDPKTWPPRAAYMEQVRHTLRVESWLGDMLDTYLAAHGANTGEHQDQGPATLEELLPGMEGVKRQELKGIGWMVPDCIHESHGGELCTWRVLAVHRSRVRVAGYVMETVNGYQAHGWDADGTEWETVEQSFRELAIADVIRSYEPQRHDRPSPAAHSA